MLKYLMDKLSEWFHDFVTIAEDFFIVPFFVAIFLVILYITIY